MARLDAVHLASGAQGCVCWVTGLSIRRVERDILRDLSLPAVTVCEQAFLVVVEFLGCLGRELEVRSQDDGVGSRCISMDFDVTN